MPNGWQLAFGNWQLAIRRRQQQATARIMTQIDKTYSNPEIRSYRDLVAWEKTRALIKRIYGATALFPKDECFGLTQQVRRAAVSIPSNIAEGYGRGSLRDYIRFLQMARGSLFELETQIILSNDLRYLTHEQMLSLIEDIAECSRILQGLIASLKKKMDP